MAPATSPATRRARSSFMKPGTFRVTCRKVHQRQIATATPRIEQARSGHITGPPFSKYVHMAPPPSKDSKDSNWFKSSADCPAGTAVRRRQKIGSHRLQTPEKRKS